MRRIETKDIREKKKRTLQIVMGFVLITLMISSTIGFALVFHSGGLNFGGNDGGIPGNNIEDIVTYNGIEFSQSLGFWQSTIRENVVVTRHNPEETEGLIDFEASINDFLNNPLYYITDDESASAIQEIVQNIGTFSSRRPQEACLDSAKCRSENLVIKTCSDNIIALTLGEEIKAYKEGNCIFLEAPSNEAELISDALVFKVLGVQ